MYPTIHSYDGRDLGTQGYGALADAISCAVTEELNGGFTLELKYPLKGIHNEYLIPGNIIMAKPAHNQSIQPFRIHQIKKSLTNSITVYANHISYDLSGYPMTSAQTYNSLADVINALNGASWSTGTAAYNQFVFDTDFTSSKAFSMPAAQTVKSWMGAMLETYGGEWEYDNFGCHLTARRGEDTGLRISYGKNLAEYLKQMDYSNYSHVCAVWKKSDITVMSGLVATGASCAFRCAYIDATKDFDAQPTVAQLDAYAEEQTTTLNLAEQTITVTPVQIGNVIGMGDSVLICYENVFETRVIKTVWDALGNRYTKLELGTQKPNIADTIKSLNATTPDLKLGTLKTADWTANSSSSQLAQVTDALTLANGVWMILAKTPTLSSGMIFTFRVNSGDTDLNAQNYFSASSNASSSVIVSVTSASADIALKTGTAASCTYDDISRGGLQAVKVG